MQPKTTQAVWKLLVTVVVGLGLPGATPAWAADGSWSSITGGDYANSANWDGGNPPDGAGKASFLSNASYRVDFSGSVTNRAADFEAAGGTVTLNIGGGMGSAFTNLWVLTNSVSRHSFNSGVDSSQFPSLAWSWVNAAAVPGGCIHSDPPSPRL